MKAPEFPKTRLPFFYGWVIVGIAFLAEFGGMLKGGYALTVMLVPMSQALGWSRTAIVAANFVASISASLVSPLQGRIVDKYGVRAPMAIAAFVAGLTVMAVAGVRDLWVFYAIFGVLSGLTRPMVQVIGVSVGVANWFVRRRPMASAIVSFGIPVSGAVGIPLVQFLVLNIGWRSTWVVMGALLIILVSIPTAIFMRQKPEDMGLVPDGKPQNPETSKEKTASKTPSRWGRYQTPVDWEATNAMKTRAFWVLALILPIIALTGPAFATHVVAFFLDKGLSPAAAAAAASNFILGTLIARFFWGVVSSRLHIQYCYAVLGIIAFLGTAFILVAPTILMAYAATMFFGVAAGGLMQLRLQVWPDYFGRKSIGTMRGYSGPFELLGGALGPLFAAWVYDTTGSYNGALTLYAALSAISVVIILFLGRPPKHPAASVAAAPQTERVAEDSH